MERQRKVIKWSLHINSYFTLTGSATLQTHSKKVRLDPLLWTEIVSLLTIYSQSANCE